MGKSAFFFQKASLLLQDENPAAMQNLEMPLAYRDFFHSSDVFEVPDITGSAHEQAVCGVSVPPEAPLPPRWKAVPVRQILSTLTTGANGNNHAGRMLRAFHIAQWRLESRFCGSCGCKNTDAAIGSVSGDDIADGPARLCPSCGRMEFSRIAPAVMVRITNGEGKILLAHNKKFAPGVYSLIAGFVEAGETLEAATARETREETGIEIGDIRYLASQPWPFPHSLMICYSARYVSGSLKPDGIEIEEAQWFDRSSLPALPLPGSVARRLIEQWLDANILPNPT
ncbi:MAG: NAD(+) diphosphatase [Treponema sp.]|nr:NAD(+) diphosphatase [Treponema sp.]